MLLRASAFSMSTVLFCCFEAWLNTSSDGNCWRICANLGVDVGIGHGDLARGRLLRQQLDADQLIQHAAEDAVALIRWDRALVPLLERGDGFVELGLRHRLAVHAREHVGNDGGNRLRRARSRPARPSWTTASGGVAPGRLQAAAIDEQDDEKNVDHSSSLETRARVMTRRARDTGASASSRERAVNTAWRSRAHGLRVILNVLFGLLESEQRAR